MEVFPFTLPVTSGSNQFFTTVNNLELLPENEDDGMRIRTMKVIARCVIGAVVFPIFCVLGAIYNGVVGLVKLGVTVFKHIYPRSRWFEGVNPELGYREAFKHLVYFGVDIVGYIFTLVVAGGFAFDPAELSEYYTDIHAAVDDGRAWDFLAARFVPNR